MRQRLQRSVTNQTQIIFMRVVLTSAWTVAHEQKMTKSTRPARNTPWLGRPARAWPECTCIVPGSIVRSVQVRLKTGEELIHFVLCFDLTSPSGGFCTRGGGGLSHSRRRRCPGGRASSGKPYLPPLPHHVPIVGLNTSACSLWVCCVYVCAMQGLWVWGSEVSGCPTLFRAASAPSVMGAPVYARTAGHQGPGGT